MDHQRIEQEQIVERYLAGRLTEAETEQFEEHYLSCHECIEQLELSEAFRDGIRQAASEDVMKAAVVGRLGVAAWLARAVRARAALLATVVLAAVALLFSLTLYRLGEARLHNAELTGRLAEARAPQANALVLALSPERGDSSEAPSARVRLPAAPGWIVLSLELDRPENPSYRARLLDAGGETLWVGEELIPNHLDALTLSLYSSFLHEGDYALEVEGLSPEAAPTPSGRFAFRVLPAGP